MRLIFLFTLFIKSHPDLHAWSHPGKPMAWLLPCSLRAQASRPPLLWPGQSAVNWGFILCGSQPSDSFLSYSHLNCLSRAPYSSHHDTVAERLMLLSIKWFVCGTAKIFSDKTTHYFTTWSPDCCLEGFSHV